MLTTGIQIQKDTKGVARYAKIDLRKYGEKLRPFFEEIGIDAQLSPYNEEFVAKIKQSEKEFAEGKGISIDIDDLWK